MASKQSIPFFDMFLGLLELLFKDGATEEFSFPVFSLSYF